MRILVIEDEKNLSELIVARLKKEKYEVDSSLDGIEGQDYALSNIYDLIILDIMLPGINGIDILKNIKNNNIDSKVIMLTAKSMIEDKLTSFNIGANDYITKPFHMEELVARVNGQLRNKNKMNLNHIEVFDIRLDQQTSKLENIKTGDDIELMKKEYLLIEYFMQNPNILLSREKIFEKVWGYFSDSESNNVEAYLSFLRRKLKAINSNVKIKTSRGLGYMLTLEQ